MDKQAWWGNSDKDNPTNEKSIVKFNPRRGISVIVIVFMLTIAGLIAGLVFGPNLNAPKRSDANSIISSPTINDSISQCSGNFQFNPTQENFGKIPDSYTDKNSITLTSRDFNSSDEGRIIPIQPFNIPAYGYFVELDEKDSHAIQPKVYKPKDTIEGRPIDKQLFPYYLGYLWNGGTILWYNSNKVSAEEVESFKKFHEKIGNNKLAILPWYKSQKIPLNKTYALSMWNVTKHCNEVTEEIYKSYIDFAKENRNSNVGKPPVAPLNKNQDLYEIDPSIFSHFIKK